MHERLEQAREEVGSDAEAVVANADLRLAFDGPDPRHHLAALASELGSVVEQVADDLREARLIRFDPRGVGGVDAQVDAAILERRPVIVTDPWHHLSCVEARRSGLDLPTRDAGHVQEVLDHARKVAGLTLDDLSRSRGSLAVLRRVIEQVQAAAEGSERVAKLVRQDGDELALSRIGLAKRLEGTLELAGPPDHASLQVRIRQLEALLRFREVLDEQLVRETKAERLLEGPAAFARDSPTAKPNRISMNAIAAWTASRSMLRRTTIGMSAGTAYATNAGVYVPLLDAAPAVIPPRTNARKTWWMGELGA